MIGHNSRCVPPAASARREDVPPIGRGRDLNRSHPRMQLRVGIPEPGFGWARGLGRRDHRMPLAAYCLGASAAVARAARWSSTVLRPMPMVLTDRCVAPRPATAASPPPACPGLPADETSFHAEAGRVAAGLGGRFPDLCRPRRAADPGPSAGTSRRPATRRGGRRAATGRRPIPGSAVHRHRRQARPGDLVEGPAERHGLLGPQSAQQRNLLLQALAARAEVLAEGLVLDAVPPMPTPSRNFPPVSRSTSAACLATSAVCRCGRMMIPVTSSMEVTAAR